MSKIIFKNKKKRIILYIFLVFTVFLLASIFFNWNLIPNHQKNKYILNNSFPLVIAHRGGSHLAPENTLLAFKKSDKLGVDILEMDVHLTRDHFLVVHHDSTINRTSEGSGAIGNFTYQQLLNYNFGYYFYVNEGTIPIKNTNINIEKYSTNYPYRTSNKKVFISKLKEIFEQLPQRNYMIEIKNQGKLGRLAAKKLIALLKQFNLMDKVIIGSFHNEIIDYVHKITNGKAILGAGPKEGIKFLIAHLTGLNLFNFKSMVLIYPIKIGFIDLNNINILSTAHKRNLAIHYWTINQKNLMQELISHKVDGILTDRPDLLIDLKKKGF